MSRLHSVVDMGDLMSEAELQAAVIELAKTLGWLVHHTRSSRTVNGWRTPVEGHVGAPDLLLAHRQYGLLLVEVKSATGKLRKEQEVWRDVLQGAGEYRWFCWRPADWRSGRIEAVLRGEP